VMGGVGLMNLANILWRMAEGFTVSSEELMAASVMAWHGLIVYFFGSFPFTILSLIYFFGSPRGWLGSIGGLLVFISAVADSLPRLFIILPLPPLRSSALIPPPQYLSGVGMILMGIALFLQSRAASALQRRTPGVLGAPRAGREICQARSHSRGPPRDLPGGS